MNTLDKFLDLLKQTDTGDEYVSPKEFAKKVKSFIEEYDGSSLEGVLVSDHLAALANTFKKQMTDDAYDEFLVLVGENKGEYMGFTITPSVGYAVYDYEQDDLIDKYNEELEALAEEMRPFKEKQKALQNSIKNRQASLVDEGKAVLKSQTTSLRIDRK